VFFWNISYQKSEWNKGAKKRKRALSSALSFRIKFTYRYDDETEKLLTAGLEKFKLSSLN